eukprot:SAG22_NODE_3583_length_1632_cov_2.097195_2_plen_73_part_00
MHWGYVALAAAGALHVGAAVVFNILVWRQDPRACDLAVTKFHYPYSLSDAELCWDCAGRMILDVCFNAELSG